MIAAMDRDGEIDRQIRGKRTYRISASRATQLAATPAPELPGGVTVPAQEAIVQEHGMLRIDYDKLARALIRQLCGAGAGGVDSQQENAADIESLRAERDRMAQERNDYAERLHKARIQLDELLGGAAENPERQAEISA
ncbi:hypothetical protein ACFSVJ_06350 [Prauserella oleivorans]